MTRALIFDLDNTIYPVHSIGAPLFTDLFALIDQSGEAASQKTAVQEAIQRIPFQAVARAFQFSEDLTNAGIALLQNTRYDGPIAPFPDFSIVEQITLEKFLVTTGFTLLQNSKIDGMQIRHLFREIHIVDPTLDSRTKKDVFSDILSRYAFHPDEALVIGDDPDSEIKAARALSIPTILFDALERNPEWNLSKRITNYGSLPLAISP